MGSELKGKLSNSWTYRYISKITREYRKWNSLTGENGILSSSLIRVTSLIGMDKAGKASKLGTEFVRLYERQYVCTKFLFDKSCIAIVGGRRLHKGS